MSRSDPPSGGLCVVAQSCYTAFVMDSQTLELEIDEQIRYRRPHEYTWNAGKVKRVLEDDTVELIDEYTGGWVTTYTKNIQKQIKGPRGGKKWVPLISE